MRIIAQRGDTLIEVLLAITIFSLVAVGTMTIMNQGTNAAQRSIEITLVRQQIDAQAEALRAAQQAHTATSESTDTTWQKIKTYGNSGPYSQERCPVALADISGSFILDARTAKTVSGNWLESINTATAPPYAQVDYSDGIVRSYGLWIEQQRTPTSANTPSAHNFTINACWYGAGMGDTPMRLQTLVRLYDPS